jgi:hypothetical protein
VPGMRKDGSRVSLEFTITPLLGEHGQMSGMAAILRDVTARFEELRGLKQKVARLMQSAESSSLGSQHDEPFLYGRPLDAHDRRVRGAAAQ